MGPNAFPISHTTAPTTPELGMVMIQARAIRPATLQRTVASRRPTPDPRIEPVATWVVDSAIPSWLETRTVAAVDASAAIPCGGEISTRPLPIVRMMRQPPM